MDSVQARTKVNGSTQYEQIRWILRAVKKTVNVDRRMGGQTDHAGNDLFGSSTKLIYHCYD